MCEYSTQTDRSRLIALTPRASPDKVTSVVVPPEAKSKCNGAAVINLNLPRINLKIFRGICKKSKLAVTTRGSNIQAAKFNCGRPPLVIGRGHHQLLAKRTLTFCR
jgi:hypothetical protein